MICVKCNQSVPDMPYCGLCGWKQDRPVRSKTRRGNGQGSVYKLPNGKYKAIVVLGYDGERRKTRSQVFALKKDAIAALPTLRETSTKQKVLTLSEVYDAWLPTHRAGKSTIDCYKAAWKYLDGIAWMPFAEIDVDDLQDCIDDCPKGKRTKENIRALIGLLYKYAIPRHIVSDGLNLGQFLRVDGEAAAHREAFTDLELARIRRGCSVIPYAKDILIMCYTGFRPSEYLSLTTDNYDSVAHTLTGGSKTAAGRGRVVTVSPKIIGFVEEAVARGGPLCQDAAGQAWTLRDFSDRAFYPALEKAGIDNPMVEISGGISRHRLSPHSCRHTFATLLKRVQGAEKDKLELMGHTSGEMLRYYQDVGTEDLRRITDAI